MALVQQLSTLNLRRIGAMQVATCYNLLAEYPQMCQKKKNVWRLHWRALQTMAALSEGR